MEEVDFFKKYNEKENEKKETSFFSEWKNECDKFEQKSYELPFSNVWIAKKTIEKLPNNASVYFAILNTLRSWDYFAAPQVLTGILTLVDSELMEDSQQLLGHLL
mgnify:CR=1 FL=1